MEFKKAAKLGAYISKEYAEEFFKLIVSYNSISASEAASRIGLHIKTAQDFLEGLTELGVLTKVEVFERKRPYFRYALKKPRIEFDIDLTYLFGKKESENNISLKIRERKNADVIFNIVGSNQYISSLVIHTGEGRERKEKRVNLTNMQGKFLFYLPFPSADFLSIDQIMDKAEIETAFTNEILDIVELLESSKIIESSNKKGG